jgi:hypothetical protein
LGPRRSLFHFIAPAGFPKREIQMTLHTTDISRLAASIKLPADAHVYIGIPCPGVIDIACVNSLVQTVQVLERAGVKLTVDLRICGQHISMGREAFVRFALETSATHFTFIDADIGWRVEDLIRLLTSGFDFAAAPYRARDDALSLMFTPLPGDPPHERGFVEVQHVGFGMVVLTRSALEQMTRAYAHLRYQMFGKWFTGLFLETIEGECRYSEDFAFCRRWRALGGKVWIDPQAKLVHAGRKEWSASVADHAGEIWPNVRQAA